MRDTYNNELSRAVSLLNFEHENRTKAKNVLSNKYKIPHYYLTLIVNKIFIRLGSYSLSMSGKSSYTLWDQFHQVASEEVKSLQLQS
ncbi:MAG: hypothetical protein P1U56_20535 [Saprospiraceae bacterium]|nr:hypothetical protein [Saprospiraceae bacterium]